MNMRKHKRRHFRNFIFFVEDGKVQYVYYRMHRLMRGVGHFWFGKYCG